MTKEITNKIFRLNLEELSQKKVNEKFIRHCMTLQNLFAVEGIEKGWNGGLKMLFNSWLNDKSLNQSVYNGWTACEMPLNHRLGVLWSCRKRVWDFWESISKHSLRRLNWKLCDIKQRGGNSVDF